LDATIATTMPTPTQMACLLKYVHPLPYFSMLITDDADRIAPRPMTVSSAIGMSSNTVNRVLADRRFATAL